MERTLKHMAYLCMALIFFVLMSGLPSCSKMDLRKPVVIKPADNYCRIVSQDGVGQASGTAYGAGFIRKDSICGLPTRVILALNGNFGAVDSITYDFSYAGMNPHVRAYRTPWAFGDDEILHPSTVRVPTHYEFNIIFDSKNRRVTQAGSTTFNYIDERLVGFDNGDNHGVLEYDAEGNITNLHSAMGIIHYRYDYTQTAKNQLYLSAGEQADEMYNLMEILAYIPVAPVNLRIRHMINWGDERGPYIASDFVFTDHLKNGNGQLLSFVYGFEGYPDQGLRVNNNWACMWTNPKNVK